MGYWKGVCLCVSQALYLAYLACNTVCLWVCETVRVLECVCMCVSIACSHVCLCECCLQHVSMWLGWQRYSC
jgi:hypothetical protein